VPTSASPQAAVATLKNVADAVDLRMPTGLGFDGLRRATLVVGAGLHVQAGAGQSALASWPSILNALGVRWTQGSSYTMAFEAALRRRAAGLGARQHAPSDGEADLQKDVQKELAEATKAMPSKPEADIYGRLRGAGYADILNLNFDSLLHGEKMRLSMPKRGPTDDSVARLRWFAHRQVDMSGARVWHPHGWVERRNSLMLGQHQYAATLARGPRLQRVEEARVRGALTRAGAAEDETTTDAVLSAYLKTRNESSWLSTFLAPRPLVIIGVSLGADELVLRWALAMRARRNHRRASEAPTFHIVGPDSSGAGGTDADLGSYGIVDQIRVNDWNDAWSVVAAPS
jgi:hypothetical protein